MKQHKYASVLDTPGEADLTAHVDFAALAQSARDGGAAAFGPVSQSDLLNRLGIVQRGERLAAHNPAQREAIASAVARLTHPDQMGTLFKALAVVRRSAATPPGF
jgi:NADH dehydrogenase [ubiquinone] 1 alpha subcomplex assembly factor 7